MPPISEFNLYLTPVISDPSYFSYLTPVISSYLSLIRKAAHYSQPVGDDRFKEMIEKKYGVKMGLTRRGRPKAIDSVDMVKI